MVKRAFRYQTGEVNEIIQDLRRDGKVEIDVIDEDRIEPFLKGLEGEGVTQDRNRPWDFEAINFYDDQNFLCRVYVCDELSKPSELYLDFYKDYFEDTYDDFFFG